MGYDPKYGRITTERGEIPDDEPVILFRGHDLYLPAVMQRYLQLCASGGSPGRHVELAADALEAVQAWQRANPGRVKVPDSERSRAW